MATNMNKNAAIPAWAKLLGAGAAGLGLGGLGGYALGAGGQPNPEEAAALTADPYAMYGDPYADYGDEGDELSDEDYAAALDAFGPEEAYWKGAAAKGSDAAVQFATELSKIASECAQNLAKNGYISQDVADQFVKSPELSYVKCAQMFQAVGVAAALVDNQRG
jgi:hypothetical protein